MLREKRNQIKCLIKMMKGRKRGEDEVRTKNKENK